MATAEYATMYPVSPKARTSRLRIGGIARGDVGAAKQKPPQRGYPSFFHGLVERTTVCAGSPGGTARLRRVMKVLHVCAVAFGLETLLLPQIDYLVRRGSDGGGPRAHRTRASRRSEPAATSFTRYRSTERSRPAPTRRACSSSVA